VSVEAQALAALATVYDPELDEPITALGFVGSCVVAASGDVDVHLRLPTPQCAPNFAYLMVSDARDAVCRVPEVGEVTVVLEDHYTGDEINAAVGSGSGFDGAFPGESTGDLAALRELFQRKALLARQGRVYAALIAGGADDAGVAGLRVDDLPDDPEVRRCVELRGALGMPHGPSDAALVAGDGSPLAAADLGTWARRARLVGLSLESNGGLCRSLLRVRYGVHDPTESDHENKTENGGVAA
jgi:metal-sulfur cluster biosynthetic enzyme